MAEAQFLTYGGKPLVRKGKVIYYGDTSDKFIIKMEVLSSHKDKGIELTDDINIELMYTDEAISPDDRVVKTSKKKGLYAAMDIATIWLERALKD